MLNQQQENRLLEITANLIKFKSITPNDAGSLNYIQGLLIDLGFSCIRLDKNETTNLVATYGDIHNTPIFAFAGHVDVVPVGTLSKWTHDPFTLTDTNGILYGRGIADMKGGIASFILACEIFIQSTNNNKQNQSHKSSIMIMLTSDEEGFGIDGTPVIVDYLKKNNIRLSCCLVGEPTSEHTIGDMIKIGRRGSVNCHLEIIGQDGHIAYPHLANNPIHLFTPILQEILNIKWDDGTDDFPPTSLQMSNINSGVGVDNVIPRSLYAKFNIRYNTHHTFDSIKNKIEDILHKYKIAHNISWNNSAIPFISKKGVFVDSFIKSIQEVTGTIPKLSTTGGTSDARFLVDVSDEIVECGLPNQYIHKIDESINKSDLIKLTEIYTLLLR